MNLHKIAGLLALLSLIGISLFPALAPGRTRVSMSVLLALCVIYVVCGYYWMSPKENEQ